MRVDALADALWPAGGYRLSPSELLFVGLLTAALLLVLLVVGKLLSMFDPPAARCKRPPHPWTEEEMQRAEDMPADGPP